MKKNILLLFAVILVSSCTKESDDTLEPFNYVGSWKLVKMTGSANGQSYTGSDMEWQETYVINEDKTFSKFRERGDSTISVSGTYTFTNEGLLDDSQSELSTYIEFSFETDNAIIGNCYSNSTIEYLYFTTNNKLISTWEACDGPGLEYVKK